MSFLDRIAECNVFDRTHVRPFVVDGTRVGWVLHRVVQTLDRFADVFVVRPDVVLLRPQFADFAARTAAVDGVLRQLASEGMIKGWRDEPYPVATGFTAPPFLQIERAGVPLFGVRAHGVHM